MRLFPSTIRTIMAICFCGAGSVLHAQELGGTLRDRDGNTYTIKKMPDNRLWTTENLKINIPGGYCYENAPENCRQFGRLYTWKAAQEACRLLGDGWHLPTIEEWQQMIKWYGGVRGDSKDSGKTAYKALIAGGAAGFNSKDSGKTAYKALIAGGAAGFNIVFGGGRAAFDTSYARQGGHGFYWTATETDSANAWFLNLGKNGKIVNRHSDGEKPMAISVRCIRDIVPNKQK